MKSFQVCLFSLVLFTPFFTFAVPASYGPSLDGINRYPSNYYKSEAPDKTKYNASYHYENNAYPFSNEVNVSPPGNDSPNGGVDQLSRPGNATSGSNPNSVSPPGSTGYDPTDRRNVSAPGSSAYDPTDRRNVTAPGN